MNTFVFTCGDPNGIGPEIVLKALGKVYNRNDKFIIVSPKNVIEKSYKDTRSNLEIKFIPSFKEFNDFHPGEVYSINIPGGKVSAGKPTKISGKISFDSLKLAVKITAESPDAALITAPISKDAWRMNGTSYEGHTDFLGEYFGVKEPLMLFYSSKMIAGLVTIHKPIKSVSKLITKTRLRDIMNSLRSSLIRDFKIVNPRIAVLGLNPHSGERGKIGDEEINVIQPVLKEFKNKNVFGPFVPDAFFGMELFKIYDAVLGMYHDQVLIPFKMIAFEKGVNFTANLPIVRTSPDHGTAFDIAYKNQANPASIIEAFKLAKRVLRNRR